MKICRGCKEEKSYSEFFKHKQWKDWYEGKCKKCKYEISKPAKQKWVEENKEKIQEYQRSDKCKKSYKRWRDKNREVILQKKKEYRNNHKEKILEYNKKYYKTNRWAESKRLNSSKRRALLKTISDWTVVYYATQKLLASQWNKCNGCSINIEYRTNRELDHIIPISKWGLHTINNMQWLCKECNNSKSNHLNWEYKAT